MRLKDENEQRGFNEVGLQSKYNKKANFQTVSNSGDCSLVNNPHIILADEPTGA